MAGTAAVNVGPSSLSPLPCDGVVGQHHSPLLVVCFWSFLLPQAVCAVSLRNPYHNIMMLMYSLQRLEGCISADREVTNVNCSTITLEMLPGSF